ncbi:vanin-like protein 1 [Neodiprion lecontei]|uniref:Vanin-like protein 1 n=1 Tax=Neodiprion lecontei TaxID=441921 RepID=A0A6J0BMF5_NEOLC|nr:vanin-like protein 1 [Neodiprion lecontei]XP_015515435.2 vanin-like protein 1 [Neodiprion lecontei]XP_015515437.2 vanin-like protein 1 [Neodiprion lecontei]XP_046590734.1 vanin-like protein 1 [Neodiprion lecontei]XP_046590735.1 vanin-like protein 1 [Neodiprion lecontei]XP_046590736.1 vanin-like protein 1 [Neodiprion lecontei]XP_046590738.1 vanin-like protein 1 [Neodiprion lecontei]
MRSLSLSIAVLGLTVLAQLTFEVSAADTISYIGAVAEYYPVTNGTNGTTIATANANNYVTIIKTAWGYNADILVFPEDSLTTGMTYSDTNRTLYPSFGSVVPDAGLDIPCDNASTVVIEALKLISCAAKQYSIYVVVNVIEKENCTSTGTTSRPCPSDGYFFYNTNVVFNRTGGIVSRYRKFNLFAEPGINVTSSPENVTFTTDFNVTFGLIICNDILYKTPALSLVDDHNVTDIIFPARWFSELPYLTSIQTQSAWSYANNVNLLASGYNNPTTSNGGSGIHAGTSGKLVTLLSESAKNALLVARVPKVIDGVRSNVVSTTYPLTYEFSSTEITTLANITTVSQNAFYQDTLAPYATSVLPLTNGTTTTWLELCDRELCCSFYVNRTFSASSVNSSVNYYRYRTAVFNGVRSFAGTTTAGIQTCSVIACTNDTLASCGLRFNATETVVQPTVFNSVFVSGNFSKNSTTMQMPNSLTTDILPLNASDFTYNRVNISGSSLTNITYNLTIQSSNLYTFAIYGRNFSADELAVSSANVASSAVQLLRFSFTTSVFLAVIETLFVRSYL